MVRSNSIIVESSDTIIPPPVFVAQLSAAAAKAASVAREEAGVRYRAGRRERTAHAHRLATASYLRDKLLMRRKFNRNNVRAVNLRRPRRAKTLHASVEGGNCYSRGRGFRADFKRP